MTKGFTYFLIFLAIMGCASSGNNAQVRSITADSVKVDTFKNGLVKEYYPGGQLMTETFYAKGMKNGKSVRYFPNGKINTVAFYKGGGLSEKFEEYRIDGRMNSIHYYNKTGKTDSFKIWHDNGVIKQQGKDSSGVEVWKSYYKTGALQAINYYHVLEGLGIRKQGEWICYTEDGEIIKKEVYSNDSLIAIYGPQKENSDLPPKTSIIDDYRSTHDGWIREYYTISDSHLKKETYYENGKKNGRSIEYFETGDIMVLSNYKDDQFYGKQYLYYPYSQKMLTSYYNKKGNLDKEYISWHRNGIIKEKGTYNDGKKIGVWIYCSESGDVLRKEQH